MTHISDTQLWYPPPSMETHHHHHNNSLPFFDPQSNNNNHNQYDDDSDNSSSNNNPNYTTAMSTNTDTRSETASSLSAAGGREHMFEKPLTPSDVGKLNRLVIPKQHAEKYFPLAGATGTGDKSGTATCTGGVLLGFEDEAGKCWRFRYSYWNSSQSYVLTKGWSRYVKEKKLDAGDVVFFERHRFEPDRFFIGWRRRRAASAQTPVRSVVEEGWTVSGQSQRSFYNAVQPQQEMQMQREGCPASHRIAAHPYQTDYCSHAGTEIIRQRNPIEKAPKSGNSKKLRLFGVNLECQLEEDDQVNPDPEPQTSDGSSLSSQGPGQGSGSGYMGPTGYNYSFDYVGYPPANQQNQYMGVTFMQDVNQMRNWLG